jgi:hypothetical protein
MTRWFGHLPLASLALSPVFNRAAHTGTQFSAAERALFTACEFWVAVEGRTVVAYLGAEATEPLRYLGIVFSALETPSVARALVRAVGEFKDATTPLLRLQCLNTLQERLLRTTDLVDHSIAGLAGELRLSSEASCAMAPARLVAVRC